MSPLSPPNITECNIIEHFPHHLDPGQFGTGAFSEMKTNYHGKISKNSIGTKKKYLKVN